MQLKITLTGLSLLFCTHMVFAETSPVDTEAKPQGVPQAIPDRPIMPKPAAFVSDKHLEKMQQMIDKMRATKDPHERRKLLRAHMDKVVSQMQAKYGRSYMPPQQMGHSFWTPQEGQQYGGRNAPPAYYPYQRPYYPHHPMNMPSAHHKKSAERHQKMMDMINKSTKAHFDTMNKRIEQLQKRIDEMHAKHSAGQTEQK